MSHANTTWQAGHKDCPVWNAWERVCFGQGRWFACVCVCVHGREKERLILWPSGIATLGCRNPVVTISSIHCPCWNQLTRNQLTQGSVWKWVQGGMIKSLVKAESVTSPLTREQAGPGIGEGIRWILFVCVLDFRHVSLLLGTGTTCLWLSSCNA